MTEALPFSPALLSHTEHLTHSLRVFAIFFRMSQIPLHFFLARELSARGFTEDPNSLLMETMG